MRRNNLSECGHHFLRLRTSLPKGRGSSEHHVTHTQEVTPVGCLVSAYTSHTVDPEPHLIPIKVL